METQFKSPYEEKFVELPEPPAPPEGLKRLTDDIEDFYLNGLENYISKLGEHIRTIQTEETNRMVRFTKQLEKLKTKSSKRREDAEEDARQEFQQAITAIRRKRKHYRQMERDALNERRKYLESMEYQKNEQEILRQKLLKLGALPKTQEDEKDAQNKSPIGPFSLVFILCQIGLLLAFIGTDFLDFEESDGDYLSLNIGQPMALDNNYTFLTHITVMILFGFGFLGAWLKKYAYSSIGYCFMIAAFAYQLNFFLMGLWFSVKESDWPDLTLSIYHFINAAYGAAAVLVTFGAVLGKVTPFELLIMAIFEVWIYSINWYVCILELEASDPGGGMTIHLFGAFFSLGVTFSMSSAFANHKTIHSDDLSSNYRSDLFALLGTAFLFVFFPSFNAALAPNGTQHRAAINTILGLVASCIFSFIVSRTFRRKHFDMRDIQNASLAGGIALGSAHSLVIVPAAALLCGAVAATLTIIGYVWITPFMESKSKGRLADARGTFNLHGFSGMIAGIASIVAVGIADEEEIYAQPPDQIFEHDLPDQAGYQAACFIISIGIGLFGGIITGGALWVVRSATSGPEPPTPYTDEEHFVIPSNFQRTLKSHVDA
jgi:ammonium transporter Rh